MHTGGDSGSPGRSGARLARALEVVLWTVGLSATLGAAAAWVDGAWFQLVAQQSLEQAAAHAGAGSRAVPSAALRSDPARWLATAVDTQLWSAGRLHAFEEAAPPKAGDVLALLEIPAIALRAAVVEGTDSLALNRGIGHVEGTAPPGARANVALAAHRDGFFRRLGELVPGDRIFLEARSGRREYVVEESAVVSPDATHVLGEGLGDVLTLVTCYPFYYVGSAPERYVVRAAAAGPETASAD